MLLIDYQKDIVERHGFFLDLPFSERIQTVGYGYAEEVEELIIDNPSPADLVRILQGTDSFKDHVEIQLKACSEIGDQVYYLGAMSLSADNPLGEVGRDVLTIFDGPTKVNPSKITFKNLDEATSGAFKSHQPQQALDYFSLYFSNAPILSSIPSIQTDSITEKPIIKPATFFSNDGVYPFLRSATTVLDSFSALHRIQDSSSDNYKRTREAHLLALGIALGTLSAIAQHHFGSSLSEIAELNQQKLTRRAANNALRHGSDYERSKGVNQDRPKLISFEPLLFTIVTELSKK